MGHMSIVGPRPRLVKDIIFYDEHVLNANNVRPGIAGPAQVYDPGSEQSWENVFKRDIEYAQKISVGRQPEPEQQKRLRKEHHSHDAQ